MLLSVLQQERKLLRMEKEVEHVPFQGNPLSELLANREAGRVGWPGSRQRCGPNHTIVCMENVRSLQSRTRLARDFHPLAGFGKKGQV